MKARIIAIGTEVVEGRTIDSNSSFLSSNLLNLGIDPVSIEACRDEISEISGFLNSDGNGAEIIIVSGGLGPTTDDVTRLAFAKAFGLDLAKDEGCEKDIIEFFKSRGRNPGPMNLAQANIPLGSKPIRNSWGTAPGFCLERNGKLFYVLPGVPIELKNMFTSHVAPELSKRFKDLPKKRTTVFKMYGIPESRLNEEIDRLEKPSSVVLGFYPKMPEVDLTVTFAVNELKKSNSVKRYLAEIREHFKSYIFEEGERKIEEKLVDALINNKLTLSSAESCTGGLLASMIVNVPGSSKCFERGVVTYSDESKIELLGVSKKTLKDHGAVSQKTAIEMASGIRKISKTSIGISTTGIAGPQGGTPEKPTGTTYIGISAKNLDFSEHFLFPRDRNMNRLMTVYEIFTKLLKLIDSGKIKK
jgi:nicotinamide-nucleotide amidase